MLQVSIPLWFDSNWVTIRIPQFPSIGFNSTLVRFKLLGCSRLCVCLWSFNSTLVRFKRQHCAIHRHGHARFQFHSGSIQTFIDSLADCVHKPVSIPLWFDSNMRSCRRWKPTIFMFQFHSGSIQTAASVPSDRTAFRFNSTLVRFKPLTLTTTNLYR